MDDVIGGEYFFPYILYRRARASIFSRSMTGDRRTTQLGCRGSSTRAPAFFLRRRKNGFYDPIIGRRDRKKVFYDASTGILAPV